MRRVASTALFALLVSSCAEFGEPCPEDTVAQAEPAELAKPQLDARDQYALVLQIVDALRRSPDDQIDQFARIRSAWEGKRFRWEARFVPPLCDRPDRCVAAGFDHRRFDRRIVQGWMPRLQLDAEQHTALSRACAAHRRCVFTFEGELRSLSLSVDEPTSVTFAEVQIESARAATDEESWIRRRPVPASPAQPRPRPAKAAQRATPGAAARAK